MVFFLAWAELKRWVVPLLHVRIVLWLEARALIDAEVSVLEVFRGAAKSTIVALYEAWRFYQDGRYRILNQSADDATAFKINRDVRAILVRHPLCEGMYFATSRDQQKQVKAFSVVGNDDPRNASLTAAGILSNVTSSRADEVVNDDVEVPRNIRTPEAREQMRLRLDEQTHIMVPGALQLFVGTPHTHNSLYDQQIAAGANVLKIPLFEHHARHDSPRESVLPFHFTPGPDGLYVFHGMKLLSEPSDYTVSGQSVVFERTPLGLVDIYAGCAWPDRFDRRDIARRRSKCKTLNTWDSQYMLIAKPLHDVRLDPDKLIPYDVRPDIRYANGAVSMFLGTTRIVGAVAYWDVATGKPDACDSVVNVLLTDESGNYYIQDSVELEGDIFDPDCPTTRGQCAQVRDIAIKYQLPNVYIEVNGLMAMATPMLRRALAGTGCGVLEVVRKEEKHKYICEALETPLSSQILWAHVAVCDGKLAEQMRDYIPGSGGQLIDHLDAAAGAVKQTPVRIGRIIGTPKTLPAPGTWRPDAGTHEVVYEGADE